MITSVSNERIKQLVKYRNNAKERRKQDVFLVEGIRMFKEIPPSLHIETFVTEDFYEKNRELFSDIRFELVSDHVMDVISDTKTPQGVLSVVKRLHYSLEEVCKGGPFAEQEAQEDCSDAPLLFALENLQDPGNLGTILRTAEGAGVTGIVMSKNTVDIYNPKTVRSTMGSIFRIPFCYVENLAAAVGKLGEQGYRTLGAHMQGTRFYDLDYRNPTVFCIGNEGNGLSKELMEALSAIISIPMKGRVESLNAATAATVLMYEAMRQRET